MNTPQPQPLTQSLSVISSPFKIKFRRLKDGAIVPDGNSQLSYHSDDSKRSRREKKKRRHRGTLNPGRYYSSDEEESWGRGGGMGLGMEMGVGRGRGRKRYGYAMNSGRFDSTQLSVG